MAYSNKIKTRITTIIEDSELSLTELAKELGMSHTTLSNTKKYGVVPKAGTIIKIANYMNVPFEYVLGKTDIEIFEKSESNNNFYDRMDFILKMNNLKFHTLAVRYLKVDPTELYQWKKKKHLPSIEILLSIAKYFKCSVDYLLGRTDDIEPYKENEDFDIDYK